jgi:ParB-like chromosome segregation protein Spo0J
MEIQRLPLSRLMPASYNPRVRLRPGDQAYERLARSLDEFDLVQPLVWNRRTGHLVGGHQRLEVLRTRGATEVECVVVDLPLAREQALNIALNNREVAGEWDERQLVAVVEGLLELPDFDATLTGFDEQELRDLVLGPDPMEERLDGEDDDAEVAAAEVVATLEIPYVRWAAVRARLDELLEAEAAVALHVRLPGRAGNP